MDMLIFRLKKIIQGLQTIKDEMDENGLVEFRGVNIDHLINRAIVARNMAREMRRFVPDDYLTLPREDEDSE